ncbi:hypothetical protein B0J14DRAFT_672021 [Halenospora varia]|nr:hypothetical protein B0J14DRAFT_672021 [Halenospora varia]
MDYPASDAPEEHSLRPSTSPRPCSSVYSDNFELQDLVHQVDESVGVAQLNTIEQLLQENTVLQEDVARHRRMWNVLMDLFDETFDMELLLRGSLEECKDKRSAAEVDWLASWGIRESVEVENWI